MIKEIGSYQIKDPYSHKGKEAQKALQQALSSSKWVVMLTYIEDCQRDLIEFDSQVEAELWIADIISEGHSENNTFRAFYNGKEYKVESRITVVIR